MIGISNIYERLFAIKLPRFYAGAGRNARAVIEVMTEYLAAVGVAGLVEREIAETVQEIDARVYELYGLGAGAGGGIWRSVGWMSVYSLQRVAQLCLLCCMFAKCQRHFGMSESNHKHVVRSGTSSFISG
ncbi:hypothetical protein DRO03_05095 [Methanosarcinales archaeon]|nr:MAG: hypothetical protein DRO03_05095 [Methanosarcinales archaeon]